MRKTKKVEQPLTVQPNLPNESSRWEKPLKLPAAFTKTLAREIVKNITSLGEFTSRPFRRADKGSAASSSTVYVHPVLVDTSVLIDGRIVPVVNSGFMAGTLLIPQFVLEELQHIADSSDAIRRTKGRRGLEVASMLKTQKVNDQVTYKVIDADVPDVKEVDHKLAKLAKMNGYKLMTVDFNLAQLARAQGIKIMNLHDLGQAIKIALIPGEEFSIRISHAGKEHQQGVGYLEDGTMVIVDGAKDSVGLEVKVTATKIHQTPAGQLFFARLS